MKSVAIIDYGSGNLRSVAKALECVAGGAPITVTSDASALERASHIVLPGVGAFGNCVRGLLALPGMREALEANVLERGKPLLGICVGMQMLLSRGHEHGVHEGLGWIEGEVVKLADSEWGIADSKKNNNSLITNHESPLKIPHMGWNGLALSGDHPLLRGITNGDEAYFVHSYHARCTNPNDVIATTDYGGTVTAAIARGNIMGTQFHPEKSQKIGLKLLENFIAMERIERSTAIV